MRMFRIIFNSILLFLYFFFLPCLLALFVFVCCRLLRTAWKEMFFCLGYVCRPLNQNRTMFFFSSFGAYSMWEYYAKWQIGSCVSAWWLHLYWSVSFERTCRFVTCRRCCGELHYRQCLKLSTFVSVRMWQMKYLHGRSSWKVMCREWPFYRKTKSSTTIPGHGLTNFVNWINVFSIKSLNKYSIADD